MTVQEMVEEFHRAFRLFVKNMPSTATHDQMLLRLSLMEEELAETAQGMWRGDLAAIADGLADLAYVVYDTALVYGIDLDAVIREVHRSNMSKLGEDGKPIYRDDGKVLKGPNYSPPNIEEVLWPNW